MKPIHTESRMRENCTYGLTRGSRRKTAKSVLRVVEDRAGVPDNKGRSALLYTLSYPAADIRLPDGTVETVEAGTFERIIR